MQTERVLSNEETPDEAPEQNPGSVPALHA
jgi:hypothetical protein